MALKLPASMIQEADQARARADEATTEMIAEMRTDLNNGVDPTALWWTVAYSSACCDPTEIAAALASVLLRLANTGR